MQPLLTLTKVCYYLRLVVVLSLLCKVLHPSLPPGDKENPSLFYLHQKHLPKEVDADFKGAQVYQVNFCRREDDGAQLFFLNGLQLSYGNLILTSLGEAFLEDNLWFHSLFIATQKLPTHFGATRLRINGLDIDVYQRVRGSFPITTRLHTLFELSQAIHRLFTKKHIPFLKEIAKLILTYLPSCELQIPIRMLHIDMQKQGASPRLGSYFVCLPKRHRFKVAWRRNKKKAKHHTYDQEDSNILLASIGFGLILHGESKIKSEFSFRHHPIEEKYDSSCQRYISVATPLAYTVKADRASFKKSNSYTLQAKSFTSGDLFLISLYLGSQFVK